MQALKMRDYGLTPLTQSENVDINGGVVPWFAAALLTTFIMGFGDFTDGFSAGYHR